MEKKPLLVLAGLIIAIGAIVVLYLVVTERHAMHSSSSQDLSHQTLFSDGEYGFTLHFPDTASTSYRFAQFYHLGNGWRADALTDATGSPVLAVIAYATTSDHSYPRYFDAEVRVGASSDPKETIRCLNTGDGETAQPDTTIQGSVWKTFSFEGAGMMQYVQGVSYRTMHEGNCIAVEKVETGSRYHDDAPSPNDVPQATLDAAYASLDGIVSTFTFAR